MRKFILLIDAAGALLTGLLLVFLVGSNFEFFKVPLLVTKVLSGVAFILCLCSLGSYIFLRQQWKKGLWYVARANVAYIILSLLFVFYSFAEMSMWGLAYFGVEAVIIGCLVWVELRVLREKQLYN